MSQNNDAVFQHIVYEVIHRGYKSKGPLFDPLVYLRNCPIADKMHEGDPRIYAFYEDNHIHFSKAFESLSEENKRGLIAHEIGHYLDDIIPTDKAVQCLDVLYHLSSDDPEIRADLFAEEFLKTRIYYDKEKVQWSI